MILKNALKILPNLPFCKLFTDKDYNYGVSYADDTTYTFDECSTTKFVALARSSPFDFNAINSQLKELVISIEVHIFEHDNSFFEEAFAIMITLQKYSPSMEHVPTKKGLYSIIKYKYKEIVPCEYSPTIITNPCS